jgi:uncharacterized protein (TIGR03086 family)
MVDKVISHVTTHVMEVSTPCEAWNVKDLTNHLINELAWIAPLLEGKTVQEVGKSLDGDLIGDNAASSWLHYCELASKAIAQTSPDSITHLSYADKPAQAYVDEVAADIIVHGWDLAMALGVTYNIDDRTASAVLNATKDIMPMARQGGFIGSEVTVSEDASELGKMLAAYGRASGWGRSA